MNFVLCFIIIGIAQSASPIAVSPSGRLLEVITEEDISGLDNTTQRLLRERAVIDENRDAFAFDLTHGWPSVVLTTIGNLTLNMSSRSRDRNRFSFGVEGEPNKTVAFVHDCVHTKKVVPHPALSEGWFAVRAHRVNVGNIYHYISPPVTLPENIEGMNSTETQSCREAGAAFRFFVYEKPRGQSLRFLMHRTPLPGDAFTVGKALLIAIKRLHTAKVVHGSLSLDDIFLRKGGFDLTGFEKLRGTWIEGLGGKSLPVNRTFNNIDSGPLQSPWELADGPSHQYTVRDDVYRVLQITSIMLNGLHYESRLKWQLTYNSLLRYKLMTPVLYPDFFLIPVDSFPVDFNEKLKLIGLMNKLNSLQQPSHMMR